MARPERRFRWAAKRQTKREIDWVYSLLGIFGIHMPLIYGEEKESAVNRLKRETNEDLKYENVSYYQKGRSYAS